MVNAGAIWRACWLLPVLFALGACAELPRIAGAPLPPAKDEPPPMYRDLADIPEPPPITPVAENESTIQTLTEDRAKTAQAAEDLRRQPFDQPDNSKLPGF
jgi:hypothetical protein